MPSSLRSPPGPIRVSSGLPVRSAVLSSTPARSGRRVQQLHPADTCGRRRRQVVSRASSHIRAVGFSGVQSGWVWAPSRLRSLTWIRCRTPPFLLLPARGLWGRWPAVVGLSARRRGHRQPDRIGLAVHSRASVLRTVRTGSCRWSRSMRATSFCLLASASIRRIPDSSRPQDVVVAGGIVRPTACACAHRRQGASLRSAPASRG